MSCDSASSSSSSTTAAEISMVDTTAVQHLAKQERSSDQKSDFQHCKVMRPSDQKSDVQYTSSNRTSGTKRSSSSTLYDRTTEEQEEDMDDNDEKINNSNNSNNSNNNRNVKTLPLFFQTIQKILHIKTNVQKGKQAQMKQTLAHFFETCSANQKIQDISIALEILQKNFTIRMTDTIVLSALSSFLLSKKKDKKEDEEKSSIDHGKELLEQVFKQSKKDWPTFFDVLQIPQSFFTTSFIETNMTTFSKLIADFQNVTGTGSGDEKSILLQTFFTRHCASANDIMFCIQICLGKLKIGMEFDSVLEAFALATHHNYSTMKTAFAQNTCVSSVVHLLLVEKVSPQVIEIKYGTPCRPMLSKMVTDVDSITNKTKSFVCEYKYDGQRIQIHWQAKDNLLVMFSRDLTILNLFPTIQQKLQDFFCAYFSETSFVLDGEIVPYDVEEEVILPMNMLRTRSENRTHEERVFLFDILLLNDELLYKRPLVERRECLTNTLFAPSVPILDCLHMSTALVTNTIATATAFMMEAIENACEGLVLKALDEPYACDEQKWLKLKKDYKADTLITFDLVPMQARRGNGARRHVLATFEMGMRNSKTGELESVCWCGSGFKMSTLAEIQKEILQKLGKESFDNDQVVVDLMPLLHQNNAWTIWEILPADVMHIDGKTSLRFPRFYRFRPDKTRWEEISSLEAPSDPVQS
jgi:DNA ligase-1